MAVGNFYTDFFKKSTSQQANRSTSNKFASQRGERVTCHLEICLLNRLNLCELFFEESVREGGVIIFVKKWVLIRFLMD